MFLDWFYPEKPPATPAPGVGKCLPGFMPYGHSCYLVYNGQQGFSWPDSRHFCQEAKAELVSLHSRAEVEFVRNLNSTKKHNIWIGLTRDRNCNFKRVITVVFVGLLWHDKPIPCFFVALSWLGLDGQDICCLPKLGSWRTKCSLSPWWSGRGELRWDVPRRTMERQQLPTKKRLCMPSPPV